VKLETARPEPQMVLERFLERHETALREGHGWEYKFAREVLGRVDGLDFADIELQTEFVDDDGVRRRIDFTISEGPYVRIAIEVDGFKKAGALPDYAHFEKWLLREQEIVRRGWRLLRFANSTVKHDPAPAARNLQLTLQKERAVALALELADAGAPSGGLRSDERKRLKGASSSLRESCVTRASSSRQASRARQTLKISAQRRPSSASMRLRRSSWPPNARRPSGLRRSRSSAANSFPSRLQSNTAKSSPFSTPTGVPTSRLYKMKFETPLPSAIRLRKKSLA
jgi:hypothetical protein